MVKIYIALVSLIFIQLIASEFTASVDQREIYMNENFSLTLTLKDTTFKETPSLKDLEKDFFINSKQHLTNTSFINGKVFSNIVWKISLTPKSEGAIQIPSIAIHTAEGLLFTQAIHLNVLLQKSSVESSGLTITTDVTNRSPYKNEPFIYTARLISKVPLYNLRTQKIQVQDAIVELLNEPQLEEQVIDNHLLHVVEFHYLITPLTTGILSIPKIAIHGAVSDKKDQLGSFLNHDFPPYSFFQGINHLKPFTIATEELKLAVQAPSPAVFPWLPAKNLILEELPQDNQTLRVGEPFLRRLRIKAEGLKASQIPHLHDLHNHEKFKVYADKPEVHEEVMDGLIHSTRQEQYTLIPQGPGSFILPQISIHWWDSVNKEKRISTIPARTVDILPSSEITPIEPNKTALSLSPKAATDELSTSPHLAILYGIIAALTFLLIATLYWGFAHRKKMKNQEPKLPPKKIKPSKKAEKVANELPDLNPT